jgi:hypothetical protein
MIESPPLPLVQVDSASPVIANLNLLTTKQKNQNIDYVVEQTGLIKLFRKLRKNRPDYNRHYLPT